MKHHPSFIVNLLMSSTLFWGVPSAEGTEDLLTIPTDTTTYCRSHFPPVREDVVWSGSPLRERTGGVIVLYDPCDHDPLGQERSAIIERPSWTVDVK